MSEIIVVDPDTEAVEIAVSIIQTAIERAADIPAQVIRAGAILAVQVGANPNPLAGELYIYPIMGKWTPYLGIAYYRRIAEERGARVMFSPGRNQSDEPRAMTDDERAYYGVPDRMLASICKGFRGDRLVELMDRGIPWTDAAQMIARTGLGYLSDDEMKNRNGQYMSAPHGRSWQWKCDKRAEMDLYRKLGVVADVQVLEREAVQIATEAQEGVVVPYTVDDFNKDMF